MKKIAKVTADTSTLQHLLKYQRSSDGTMFWKYEFQLVLKFGAPEIKAQLLWFEEVSRTKLVCQEGCSPPSVM